MGNNSEATKAETQRPFDWSCEIVILNKFLHPELPEPNELLWLYHFRDIARLGKKSWKSTKQVFLMKASGSCARTARSAFSSNALPWGFFKRLARTAGNASGAPQQESNTSEATMMSNCSSPHNSQIIWIPKRNVAQHPLYVTGKSTHSTLVPAQGIYSIFSRQTIPAFSPSSTFQSRTSNVKASLWPWCSWQDTDWTQEGYTIRAKKWNLEFQEKHQRFQKVPKGSKRFQKVPKGSKRFQCFPRSCLYLLSMFKVSFNASTKRCSPSVSRTSEPQAWQLSPARATPAPQEMAEGVGASGSAFWNTS